MGINDSVSAIAKDMMKDSEVGRVMRPLHSLVMEGSPPRARPTNSATVGKAKLPSAHLSGYISDTAPAQSPKNIGKSVKKLFLKLLNKSAIAPTSLSYIPRIAAIEPPEKPGIINATPIK